MASGDTQDSWAEIRLDVEAYFDLGEQALAYYISLRRDMSRAVSPPGWGGAYRKGGKPAVRAGSRFESRSSGRPGRRVLLAVESGRLERLLAVREHVHLDCEAVANRPYVKQVPGHLDIAALAAT